MKKRRGYSQIHKSQRISWLGHIIRFAATKNKTGSRLEAKRGKKKKKREIPERVARLRDRQFANYERVESEEESD